MHDKKTILIVDDHPLFREGLKTIIARDPQFQVIGEAGSGSEAMDAVQEKKPQLVLMDISLPDMNGIQLTQRLKELMPEVRVIIVSMHNKIDYITKAFHVGAYGYISKESASEKLLQGLVEVSNGEYFLGSGISHRVVKKLLESPGTQNAVISDEKYNSLTPRENEVLKLLAEGSTTKELAEKLCISPKTVETHRTNIMAKLNLHSTLDLIRYAARLGLIDVDLWKE